MDKMTLTLNSPIAEEQLDAITDVDFEHTNEITFHTKHGKIVKFVRASAEPVRMKGRWVPITESDCSGYDPVLAGYEDPVVGYVCSVCGDGQEKEVMDEPLWNFCPNCGARMSEGEEDD